MRLDDLDVERLLADANAPAQIRATRAETIALCKRVLALEAALREIEAVNDPLPAAVRSIARAALEGDE